jgi:plastocyanin
MNSLDSRALTQGDTYGQKFSRAGRYNYDFGLSVSGRLDKDAPFTITVKEASNPKRTGKQHFVAVRRGEEKRNLQADPPQLSIEAGDLVMWSAADSSTPGFSVSGRSENDSFSSAALSSEAVYTHAFGSAGEITWKDANGGRSSGKVTVTMPSTKPKDLEAYKARLAKGTLVTIRSGRAEPSQVEILVGQTVFFAVEKTEGITITDQRLIFELPTTA